MNSEFLMVSLYIIRQHSFLLWAKKLFKHRTHLHAVFYSNGGYNKRAFVDGDGLSKVPGEVSRGVLSGTEGAPLNNDERKGRVYQRTILLLQEERGRCSA